MVQGTTSRAKRETCRVVRLLPKVECGVDGVDVSVGRWPTSRFCCRASVTVTVVGCLRYFEEGVRSPPTSRDATLRISFFVIEHVAHIPSRHPAQDAVDSNPRSPPPPTNSRLCGPRG